MIPLELLLRVAVGGAFVGHGAYGVVMAKPAWFDYFGALGVSRTTVAEGGLISLVGAFEIVLGVFALAIPLPPLLLFMTAWKVFTELLRPAVGEPWWEFIERGSNIVAPLALFYVLRARSRLEVHVEYDRTRPQSESQRGHRPGRAGAGR